MPSVTRQGLVPRPMLLGDHLSTRLPRHSSHIYSSRVPNAAYYGTPLPPRCGQGEAPSGSFGACTPPHRRPLCGVVGCFFSPVRNEIQNLNRLSFTSFCDDLFDYILLHLTRFDYFFFFGRQTPVAGWPLLFSAPGGR